jgi:hypothetical protein
MKTINKFCDYIRWEWFNKFSRGQLIKFRCHFDGKVGCSWDAIYHGKNKVHSVGKRKMGKWEMSKRLFGDKITRINHGFLIERFVE